ncbi:MULTISPECIES: proline--tRNA ligase [unclassified Exiguobacterium]|uniref:proline--tRNA ligase n=1 Tax=unclassified Exiguobacterium TaxID=2644629 RepID=UPI00103EB88A|nr:MULTISPECIES: proline--tRNA ligase [unclassified Exiguobacterium]TCI37321.1 proline--tRNA ligase [Exiguobacterium sp. SH4S7]TCI45451.1 proline--tRNA ligase [Exiguobacterium sp. SH5S32]TCI52652.1 proline--tRNA ligase [Exiguobacterium sp. SH1S4]TCI70841.1 proline--tRNA ligase [Exiguobacterium sp. SH1S1]TCI80156.1 proline--tRNA ligase [Exiguobacterium sp. SH0S1]
MKQSRLLMPTLREVPADAEAVSHQLLVRGGFIRQNAAGIYSYLPLGHRVLQNIQTIIREEMNRAGAQELLMPAIQPAELWEETGRWDIYGPELMRLTDRHDRRFALGATHEELITSIVRDELNSYKKLPVNLYQIQTKYRDERRPRFGLLRGREFLMKDAYSFHATQADLDEEYDNMYNAYSRIFDRTGLKYRPVVADSGAIGGKDTHEFQALAEIGEDTIVYTDSSSYAANIEMAETLDRYDMQAGVVLELDKVDTKEHKTIEDVARFLGVETNTTIKSVLFNVDGETVMAIVRGDHEANDVKVKNALGGLDIQMEDESKIIELFGCEPGTLGPINAPVKVVADYAVKYLVDAVCGANVANTHFMHVNAERDLSHLTYHDLRFVVEGDLAPDESGPVRFARGIEVGQVFKLGTRYSEAMGATFLNEEGRAEPLIMGCYGIGVSRTLSAIVEQHHDDRGIVWPKSVAPFDLHLIAINAKDETQLELSNRLYDELSSKYDVLYDDRKERAGVKFADADLIGLPIRINVGKKAGEGIVEVKVRATGEVIETTVEELPQVIVAQLNETH